MVELTDNDFKNLEKYGNFDILSVDKNSIDTKEYKKINIDIYDKAQISEFMSHIPQFIFQGVAKDGLYILKFPKGVNGTLMKLNRGGYTTSILDPENKITAQASLHNVMSNVVMGFFNCMSVVTGQYFLACINKELKLINQNIDKILEFLYGDKKAELLAEVSFTKYAYENYSSIMKSDAQKTATIVSLQEAKKVAIKDIEFYMNDLYSVANTKEENNLDSTLSKAFLIKESLELSIQLYVMVTILEMHYSQNTDDNYIEYINSETSIYISKCEKRILSSFSILHNKVNNFKPNLFIRFDKNYYSKEIEKVIEVFNKGEDSELQRIVYESSNILYLNKEYLINKNGELYVKDSE